MQFLHVLCRLRALSLRSLRRGGFVFSGLAALAALFAVFARLAVAQILPGALDDGTIYVTDLSYFPLTVQLSWSNVDPDALIPSNWLYPGIDHPVSGDFDGGTQWTTLHRSPGSTVDITSLPSVPDPDAGLIAGTYAHSVVQTYQDMTCSIDTSYTYYLTGLHYTWHWVEDTDLEEGGYWYSSTTTVTGPSASVTVKKVASANQTADTRIDPRFDVPPLKNFKFADTQFRGGLFSGYNGDDARVARTYLKFTGLPPTTSLGVLDTTLWPVGGLMVFSTRLAKSGTASIICRPAVSSSWNASTLTWGTAPAPTTGEASLAAITWDRANPWEQWVLFDTWEEMAKSVDSSGNLTLVLQAHDESGSGAETTASPGWAYFARNSYAEPVAPSGTTYPTSPAALPMHYRPGEQHGNDLLPFLLYAVGGHGGSSANHLAFTSEGYGYYTGTLTLLTPVSVDTVLTLYSGNPDVSLPSTVTILANHNSATFWFSTTPTATLEVARIWASNGYLSAYGDLYMGLGGGDE